MQRPVTAKDLRLPNPSRPGNTVLVRVLPVLPEGTDRVPSQKRGHLIRLGLILALRTNEVLSLRRLPPVSKRAHLDEQLKLFIGQSRQELRRSNPTRSRRQQVLRDLRRQVPRAGHTFLASPETSLVIVPLDAHTPLSRRAAAQRVTNRTYIRPDHSGDLRVRIPLIAQLDDTTVLTQERRLNSTTYSRRTVRFTKPTTQHSVDTVTVLAISRHRLMQRQPLVPTGFVHPTVSDPPRHQLYELIRERLNRRQTCNDTRLQRDAILMAQVHRCAHLIQVPSSGRLTTLPAPRRPHMPVSRQRVMPAELDTVQLSIESEPVHGGYRSPSSLPRLRVDTYSLIADLKLIMCQPATLRQDLGLVIDTVMRPIQDVLFRPTEHRPVIVPPQVRRLRDTNPDVPTRHHRVRPDRVRDRAERQRVPVIRDHRRKRDLLRQQRPQVLTRNPHHPVTSGHLHVTDTPHPGLQQQPIPLRGHALRVTVALIRLDQHVRHQLAEPLVLQVTPPGRMLHPAVVVREVPSTQRVAMHLSTERVRVRVPQLNRRLPHILRHTSRPRERLDVRQKHRLHRITPQVRSVLLRHTPPLSPPPTERDTRWRKVLLTRRGVQRRVQPHPRLPQHQRHIRAVPANKLARLPRPIHLSRDLPHAGTSPTVGTDGLPTTRHAHVYSWYQYFPTRRSGLGSNRVKYTR